MGVRRRATSLFAAVAVAGFTWVVTGPGVAWADESIGSCIPDSTLVFAAPECPTVNVVYVPAAAATSTNGTGGTPLPANAGCTIEPYAQAAYLGASEGGGSVTVPQVDVLGATFGPTTFNIPPASVISEAVGASVSLCDAEAGWNQDLEPSVSSTVCQALYAEVVDMSVPTSPQRYWVAAPGGAPACSPATLTGAPYGSAGQQARVYPNLPTTGAGAWYNNTPTTIYDGEYDLVGYVFGYVDGILLQGNQVCPSGASACSNYIFAD